MCYGITLSLLFAVSGLLTSFYLKRNKSKFSFYFPIMYFSLMEIFQAIQYISLIFNFYTLNVFTTIISYIHICFQPIFFNMFQYGYINKNRKIYYNVVYPLCLVGGLGMLLRLRNINTFYDKI
jgi:hypothetical protein